jgi:hypothetical protein
MFLERAFNPLEQRAASQAEARHQFDDGKAAAGLLGGRLWPILLIGGGVGHGEARAIHHFDAASQPAIRRRDASGEFLGQTLVKFQQARQRQTSPRLAISTRATGGQRFVLRHAPRLHFTDDLPARTTRTQNLAQKRPEGQVYGIGALAAVDPFGGGRQSGGGQPGPENLAQPTQRRPPPLLGLRAQLIEWGTALPPQKAVGKARKEWCVLTHPQV